LEVGKASDVIIGEPGSPDVIYLPRHINVPWEAAFGVAFQLGARPFNVYWHDPDTISERLRHEVANRREAREAEIQNFANWFTYYRSRILIARAGVGRAFAQQGTNMRVGFGAINKGWQQIRESKLAVPVTAAKHTAAAYGAAKLATKTYMKRENK